MAIGIAVGSATATPPGAASPTAAGAVVTTEGPFIVVLFRVRHAAPAAAIAAAGMLAINLFPLRCSRRAAAPAWATATVRGRIVEAVIIARCPHVIATRAAAVAWITAPGTTFRVVQGSFRRRAVGKCCDRDHHQDPAQDA